MSTAPFLADIDLNYAELLKGRIENVSSLPTGLGTSHRGYCVIHKKRIWMWDGSQWYAQPFAWTNETNQTFDPQNPNSETTAINGTSSYLNSFWNIHLSLGYSDSSANTLGMLHFLGNSSAVNDWEELDGRRFVVSAIGGAWFNIKHLSNNTPPSNHRVIDTRMGQDLMGVVKAEFSYNRNTSRWELVSFERKSISLQNWYEERYTSWPNDGAPVNEIRAINNSQDTRTDIAIVGKGLSALTRQVPNGGQTGGFKRGAGAVDLQIIRDNADEVASGDVSVICGGASNKNNGLYGFIGGGLGNYINRDGGIIVAGGYNIVDYDNGIIVGGSHARVLNFAGENKASGCFQNMGDAQRGCYTLRNVIYSMDEDLLYLDGATERIRVLLQGDYMVVWGCELSVVAVGVEVENNDIVQLYWKPSSLSFMVYNDGNANVNVSPTLVNVLADIVRGGTMFYNDNIKLSIYGSGDYLDVKVINDSKYKLRVFGRLITAELSY